MRMPEIVNAQARKACPLRDRAPWPVEVGTRFFALSPGTLTSDDMHPGVFEAGEHRKRRCIQYDRFRARLAVGEQEQPALKVNMLPFEFQNFAQPSASQDQ